MKPYAVHGDNSLEYGDWLVLTRGIGRDPDDRSGENFLRFPHTKIVRLNHGYYPHGTIPQPEYYEDFAARCAHYVEMSPGCSRWIVGNETNVEGERPDGQPITPAMYAECYTLCRDAIKALPFHSGDQVLLAAVGPWNVQTPYPGNPSGDWVRYFEDVMYELPPGGCDGFALHTYVREQTPASVVSDARMASFPQYHWSFRAYMDWMAAILPRFQGLPVYITEFCVAGEAWRDADTGCVAMAYHEINAWNVLNPDLPISCLAMYRWEWDKWAFDDKPLVQQDFYNAVQMGYTVPAEDPEPPEEDDLKNPSMELPYITHPQHSTVKVAHGWSHFDSQGPPPVPGGNDGPFALPEYKPLPKTLDPHRVYEGDTAQCWFLTNHIMDAGIYQQVEVNPGATCQLDAMVHTWCSNSNEPHTADGEMYVRLGIDPDGGTDAFAASVAWSGWSRLSWDYKRYYSPEVLARRGRITIFIRTWNKWALKHNDTYVDDCHLTVEGGGTEPPGGGECLMDWDKMETLVRRVVRQVVREELDKTVLGSGIA